jgi:hypothetical protein
LFSFSLKIFSNIFSLLSILGAMRGAPFYVF